MKTAIVALIMLLALPAQAHTEAEQREWERDWIERAEGRVTPELVEEWVDFHIRHAPPPPIVARRTAPSPNRGMGANVEQWRGLVSAYFSDVDRALCLMSYESGGNPNAKNPSSGAAGLFQVMPFWWEHYGGDRYDPETNVRVASLIYQQQGWNAWSPYNRGLCR